MDWMAWAFMIVFFGGPLFLGVLVLVFMYTEKDDMGLFESPKDWGVNDVDQRKK
jgi:hypothetical protein